MLNSVCALGVDMNFKVSISRTGGTLQLSFSREDNYLLIFWCPVWVWKSSKWLLILKCFSWIISAVRQGDWGLPEDGFAQPDCQLALADHTRVVSDLPRFWSIADQTYSFPLCRIPGGFPSGTLGVIFSKRLFLFAHFFIFPIVKVKWVLTHLL